MGVACLSVLQKLTSGSLCLCVCLSVTPEDEGEAKRIQPKCTHCKDVPSRTCRFCGCYVCGEKNDPGKQLLCDECDMAYHLGCLNPPLDAVPEEDEWYCPECKNDEGEVIRAGEKLRYNKKKAKMISKVNDCKRDWGKVGGVGWDGQEDGRGGVGWDGQEVGGVEWARATLAQYLIPSPPLCPQGMACVGRTKVCTIVPSNHFGPVPGIPVGTLWKFRVQVRGGGAGERRVGQMTGG